MAVEVLLPKLGLTMETGLIEEWLVSAGTLVRPGDPLMRLATDKVDVEVEAEAEGLFHPAVESGSSLPPGALVGWLLAEGEAVPSGDGSAAGAGTAQTPAEPGALASSSAATPVAPPSTPAATSARPVTAAADAESVAVGEPGALTPPAREGRLFASPNARRVAGERGVDLTLIRGTGPGGRVTTVDVEEAASRPASGPAPSVGSPLVRRDAVAAGVDLSAVSATGPGGKVRRADVLAAAARQPTAAPAAAAGPAAAPQVIPLTGMRGVIASRMQASLQEMAQLTLGADATMDAAVALRAQLKEQWSAAGLPVPTITDFVVRAAALALREHPRLNASVRDNAIHVLPDINIGLAVALQDGLIVPVVKNADQLPLSTIAAETRRLAEGARTSRLALPDLEGGTFTVSTLGSFGIDFFTPVITPGQVAILGVGRLRDSVRWEGPTPVRTQVLTLSITFDHRAVDGAPAAEYLRTVATKLAHPLGLLA
jgi:pyruvate/2-oxoglutarate dehydrogenase complex dihydrolipoamide acyltransferase (E2) component